MKKRVSAVVIVLVCLGGVACIKTLSTSSVGLPQLAFDNIEALASGESSAYRCYGIGDVDCHGDKVDKMYIRGNTKSKTNYTYDIDIQQIKEDRKKYEKSQCFPFASHFGLKRG